MSEQFDRGDGFQRSNQAGMEACKCSKDGQVHEEQARRNRKRRHGQSHRGWTGSITGSFIGVFPLELSTTSVNIDPCIVPVYCGAHRARDGSIMSRFPLDVEAVPGSDEAMRDMSE